MKANYVMQLLLSFMSLMGLLVAAFEPWFIPYACLLFAVTMFMISYNYKEYKEDKKALVFFISAVLFFVYAFLTILGVL